MKIFYILEFLIFQGLIHEIEKINFFYFMGQPGAVNKKFRKCFILLKFLFILEFFIFEGLIWKKKNFFHFMNQPGALKKNSNIKNLTFLLKNKKFNKSFYLMQQSRIIHKLFDTNSNFHVK